jgi:hypothetical protein
MGIAPSIQLLRREFEREIGVRKSWGHSLCGPILRRGFGIFQFFLATPVTMLFDELAGFRELGPITKVPSAVEVDVGGGRKHGRD